MSSYRLIIAKKKLEEQNITVEIAALKERLAELEWERELVRQDVSRRYVTYVEALCPPEEEA